MSLERRLDKLEAAALILGCPNAEAKQRELEKYLRHLSIGMLDVLIVFIEVAFDGMTIQKWIDGGHRAFQAEHHEDFEDPPSIEEVRQIYDAALDWLRSLPETERQMLADFYRRERVCKESAQFIETCGDAPERLRT